MHNTALAAYFRHSGLVIYDKYILCTLNPNFEVTAFCKVNKMASYNYRFETYPKGSFMPFEFDKKD
ncbi:hypothetical protein PORCRE_1802 [Porphyromonas crevioricanis JCM 15906]|uniref:Uncharacterized protein n=1 Tax=Porphyromonas crevioricanis JCM 15906 TaxID=1305617 RepID=T1DT86_9PORP|nr:hypothetical protein PORCRE_1802 [Porphyromonas crevioricanis JCM 15906]